MPAGQWQDQAPLSSALLTSVIISNKPLKQPTQSAVKLRGQLSPSWTPSPLHITVNFGGEDQRSSLFRREEQLEGERFYAELCVRLAAAVRKGLFNKPQSRRKRTLNSSRPYGLATTSFSSPRCPNPPTRPPSPGVCQGLPRLLSAAEPGGHRERAPSRTRLPWARPRGVSPRENAWFLWRWGGGGVAAPARCPRPPPSAAAPEVSGAGRAVVPSLPGRSPVCRHGAPLGERRGPGAQLRAAAGREAAQRRPWRRRRRRRRSSTTSCCPTGSAWRPRPPAFSRRSKTTWPGPCSSRSCGPAGSSGPGSCRRECPEGGGGGLPPAPGALRLRPRRGGGGAPGVKAPRSGACGL